MKKLFIPIFLIVFISACSVFQETTSYEEVDKPDTDKTDEVYVFDEVKDADSSTTSEIKDLNKEIDNTLSENKENVNNNELVKPNETVVETVTEPVTTEYEKVETTTNYEQPTTYEEPSNEVQFYVQLGAFSTLARAEKFSSQIDSVVPFALSIIFDSSREFYIVRSTPYSTRTEAESIRNELRNNRKFKDCFIVTE